MTYCVYSDRGPQEHQLRRRSSTGSSSAASCAPRLRKRSSSSVAGAAAASARRRSTVSRKIHSILLLDASSGDRHVVDTEAYCNSGNVDAAESVRLASILDGVKMSVSEIEQMESMLRNLLDSCSGVKRRYNVDADIRREKRERRTSTVDTLNPLSMLSGSSFDEDDDSESASFGGKDIRLRRAFSTGGRF